MNSFPADGGGPIPLTPQDAERLIAALVQEMTQAWRRGQRILPEDFLRRYPGLADCPEAVAELIYEEMNLRREHGEESPTEQILGRFPQWRSQLEVLFDCHRVLDLWPETRFPAAGELVDDFLLLAELGRGGLGRVFLAGQISLADRPVVLKFTPREALEHLSLARLQHTHIVPLYSVHDHPDRGLRSLCMPYFGGTVLSRLLEAMGPTQPGQRRGQDLLNALDDGETDSRLRTPLQGAARLGLAHASYVQAVCWIGACLADGLHYAHERGLVHLDLKPSNVLLAADGQPMLLDFHLARGPISPGEKSVHWFGGTRGYMSPEQRDALRALQEDRPVDRPVDQRSDIYSLGLLLYESLAGRSYRTHLWGTFPTCRLFGTLETCPTGVSDKSSPLEEGGNGRSLRRHNPQVSVGLGDLVDKCLALDPAERYPNAAALAADLRRHLTDRLLSGVSNRSLAERWRKWRRRRPHAASHLVMMLAVLMAAGAVAVAAAAYFTGRIEQAENALHNGQLELTRGEWKAAVRTLQHGLSAAREVPFGQGLADRLSYQLHLAEQKRADAERIAVVQELRQLTDRVRFLYNTANPASKRLDALILSCRTFWEGRTRIIQRLGPDNASLFEPSVREDLLDVAIFWASLQVHLAQPAEQNEGRRKAAEVLKEAETLFGPSLVLDEERRYYGQPMPAGSQAPKPQSAWEHYALGRSLLRSSKLKQAADELEQAVRLNPHGLWPNFYQGLCANRLGRYSDAAAAFSVCIGAAPQAASCFYNRALAFDALGRPERALLDYDQALRLDPTLADALRNRSRAAGESREAEQHIAGSDEPVKRY